MSRTGGDNEKLVSAISEMWEVSRRTSGISVHKTSCTRYCFSTHLLRASTGTSEFPEVLDSCVRRVSRFLTNVVHVGKSIRDVISREIPAQRRTACRAISIFIGYLTGSIISRFSLKLQIGTREVEARTIYKIAMKLYDGNWTASCDYFRGTCVYQVAIHYQRKRARTRQKFKDHAILSLRYINLFRYKNLPHYGVVKPWRNSGEKVGFLSCFFFLNNSLREEKSIRGNYWFHRHSTTHNRDLRKTRVK